MTAITENIGKLALSLRSKVAVELQSTDTWHPSFVRDPESTVMTEGGEPATEPKAFVESVKRPQKWFDNYCCQAATNIVLQDIIIFKHLRGEWHFMQRFSPTNKRVSSTYVSEKRRWCLTFHHITPGSGHASALARFAQ